MNLKTCGFAGGALAALAACGPAYDTGRETSRIYDCIAGRPIVLVARSAAPVRIATVTLAQLALDDPQVTRTADSAEATFPLEYAATPAGVRLARQGRICVSRTFDCLPGHIVAGYALEDSAYRLDDLELSDTFERRGTTLLALGAHSLLRDDGSGRCLPLAGAPA